MQKRVLAIHDISCLGRCSLTVALPIISAAGVEVAVMPTAVLSTHTGGFTGYTFRDLTDDMLPITDHWEKLGEQFDCIFSGYLGSYKQLDIMQSITDKFKTKNNILIVDPVMGDNGEIYSNLDKSFAKGFAALCARADIITPNLTEASLLTDIEYKSEGYDEKYIKNILDKLALMGAKRIILTGISFGDDNIGCAVFDNGNIDYIFTDKTDGMFHGSGDVFSSALTGAILNGASLKKAARIAADFTAEAINRTKISKRDPIYGINFEEGLYDYSKKIKNLSTVCE